MTSNLGDNAPRYLDFPFRISGEGRVGLTDGEDHMRDMIEQVLFTNPGERVNLPEFGCGLRNLVFAGNNEILRATVQFLITQNLNRWLSATIKLEQVNVQNDEETLIIEIIYALKRTLARRKVTLRV